MFRSTLARAATITGLAVAILAPAAHAGELNTQPWVKQGLTAAHKHWGQWPAACAQIRVASATDAEVLGNDARVLWVPTLEHPLTQDGCQILINKKLLPVAPAYNGPTFCTLLVHEYGHLLGWYHPEADGDDEPADAKRSSDPVMAHDFGAYVAPECKPAKPRKASARKARR